MRILTAVFLLAVSAGAQAEARARLLEEGRYLEALAAHRDLLRAEGPSYEAFMGLGRARFGLHDLGGAVADFERAEQLDPTAFEPLHEQGRAYVGLAEEAIQAGDSIFREHLRDGAEVFRRAARLAKDPFESLRQAAECLFRMGDGDGALVDVEAAMKLRPDDAEIRWLRARCLFAAGRYGDYLAAADDLEVERDVDFACSRLIALARLERYDDVELEFLELLDGSEPGDLGRVHAVLSTEWSSTKLRRRHVALLEAVVLRRPEDALARYHLGIALGRLGRFAEGAAALGRYLAIHPDAINALCDHSQLSLLAGDVEAAHRSARRALTLAPGHADARDRVGSVIAKYVADRAFDKALDLHELLVVAAPDSPDVARNHAALLKENGKLEDAALRLASLCESADVEIERLAVYLNDLALCLKGLGRIDEAEERLREAIDTWPFQIDARENLGVLRYEQGRHADAEALFVDVLDLHAREAAPGSEPRYRSRYYLRRVRAILRNR